jgi:hypothetical protein
VLSQLRGRDSDVFEPLLCVVEERPRLRAEALRPAFGTFAAWALNHAEAFKFWLKFHGEIRSTLRDLTFVRPDSVFDISELSSIQEFRQLRTDLNISHEDLIYAFDIVLRYPLYGMLAGEGSYFLAHPIRDQQNHPIIAVEPGPPPNIPISFSQTLTNIAPKMTLDEYTSFLHEARGLIRDKQIHKLKPNAVTQEMTREIAAQLHMPARLHQTGRVLAFATGIASGIGAAPMLGPVAALAGGAIAIVSAIWDGRVGRSVGKVKWLRWALEWDLEKQAKDFD